MSLRGLNIALVGPLPPPSGGMANQLLQLDQLLSSAGCKVTTVRTNAPHQPEFIHHLKGVRALFRLIPYMIKLWKVTGQVDLVHVLANSGWSWHLFSAPAVWIASWRRVPVIINYRGGEAAAFFRDSWQLVKPTIVRGGSIIVPSEFLVNIFDRYGVAARIVPNILELKRFKFPVTMRDFGNAPHLVVTRNLEAIYDIKTAIGAFARIRKTFPGATLTVTGSGPERENLEMVARTLDVEDAVVFSGRLSNEQVASLCQHADLLLNSSLEDNSPNSLIEAMASGVAVVSTGVGGIPYLVEDGVSGMLVPPRRPDLLADAANQILKDPVLRKKMILAARNTVSRFEKDKVLALFEQEYLCVLSPN